MVDGSNAPAGLPATPPAARPRRGVTALLIAAGLLSGTAAAAAVPVFGRPYVLPMYEGMFPPPGWREENHANEYRNSAASGGLLGLCLGVGLGMAAGVARRSPASAALGLAVGGVAGGLLGAGGGLAAYEAHFRLQTVEVDRTHAAMAVHAVLFGLAGLGVGLGAGAAARRPFVWAGFGTAAGLLAGIAYPVAVVVACPPIVPDHPVPDRMGPQLLWAFVPAVLIAAGLAVAGLRPATLGGRPNDPSSP